MGNLIQASERFLDNDIETRLQREWDKQIEAFRAEQPPELPEDCELDPWNIKNKEVA